MKATFCDMCGRQIHAAYLGYKVTIVWNGEYPEELDVCVKCQEEIKKICERRRREDEED